MNRVRPAKRFHASMNDVWLPDRVGDAAAVREVAEFGGGAVAAESVFR